MNCSETTKREFMKTILLLIIILNTTIAGFSQEKHERSKSNSDFWEAIKTKRIAVFTNTIGLTTAEAEQFWPVYNDFDKARGELMHKRRILDGKLENRKGESTQVDYRKIAIDYVSTHTQEARLMEDYNTRYLKILPAEKVCKLYRAERKFREYLMQEFRKNQTERKDK